MSESSSSDLSEASSSRICKHMNEDHAVSVYCMAKAVVALPRGWKLSEARLKKVTLSCCQIQAITCKTDMCEAHNVVYPFEPPLQGEAEIRSRLIQVHNKETKPKLSLFLTRPMALVTLLLWLYIIWGSRIAQDSDLARLFTNIDNLFPSVPNLSTSQLSQIFDVAFFFILAAHIFEAAFVLRGSKALKLPFYTASLWTLAVLIVGFPFVFELQELVKVHHRSCQAKKA
jgi:hypothetical protein